uniref:Fibrinogen C-terminal domain-containing protein n=1 Tax=Ciona savignyi TaxID=51511 RepID=H2ZL39_CIOSA
SGVFPVWLLSRYRIIYVYCDMDVVSNISSKRGWITIQRRLNGEINFYRNWKSYANGFGNPNGEYWVGLENIHLLTYQDVAFFYFNYYDTPPHLRLDFEDNDGVTAYVHYKTFIVSNEENNYAIESILLSGGNALTKGALPLEKDDFSTFDRNNGPFDILNCGEKLHSGWWFYVCGDSNLNGPYPKQGDKNSQSNIYWFRWETINPNNTAFKKVSMKL